MSTDLEYCILQCQECHSTCLQMLSQHCLALGGPHTEQNHFRLMMDCAQICRVAADFMLRGSPHHPHICRECAEICRECATSCARVGDMQECVEACRLCAESCAEMAKAA